MSDEKLQKVLARSGFGSRREMERWIEEGRIVLNDQPAKLGDRVSAADKIVLDGKPVTLTFASMAERRVLIYRDLKAFTPWPDRREPRRELELHLTSNMERYMWSFDGVKFSEVTKAIQFHEGERVRLTLINDTMMPHPIHLHGMFFDLVIPGAETSGRLPRKHTVIVKPADKVSVDITAEHVGDWAFHCHLLYHMAAGMMQVVSVLPAEAMPMEDHQGQGMMDHSAMGHAPVDHSTMDHSKMGHEGMNHEEMKR